MKPQERQRERDPVLMQLVRARLARMKVARTTRETHELAAAMPTPWTVIDLLQGKYHPDRDRRERDE